MSYKFNSITLGQSLSSFEEEHGDFNPRSTMKNKPLDFFAAVKPAYTPSRIEQIKRALSELSENRPASSLKKLIQF
jgi:hypothetical protein